LIRSRVCKGLEQLGIAIDPEANDRTLEEISEIGRCGHSVRVLAVRTNEELQIARETLSVLTE
jgi:acetate kinase